MEYQRLGKDLDELDQSVGELDSVLRDRKNERDKTRALVENIEGEVKDLRELTDASKRWVGDSLRIALERDQVNEKESNFRLMNSDREGRDLKQVEAELSGSLQKKDDHAGTLFAFLFMFIELNCTKCCIRCCMI